MQETKTDTRPVRIQKKGGVMNIFIESKHSSQLCCGEVLSKSITLSSCLGLE